eukprot:GSChrysophyteH1.ASY1.ANO1.296.1 assembled CDS
MASISSVMSARRTVALTWEELATIAARREKVDLENGPANSRSNLRLFGSTLDPVKLPVTLFRDRHSWCPYCQKVWLWLEEKRIPYKIKKVTMFCYGEKESWYKKLVPSGMLPALQLNGRLVTESDTILQELEKEYGPLYKGMRSTVVVPLRQLERELFREWCNWLCYRNTEAEENQAKENFLHEFSVVDTVFTPYLERMSASLFYYKGYVLRDASKNPRISAWFDAMETRKLTYRGTQSDFHTHAHDLPPQMGLCVASGTSEQRRAQLLVDQGPFEAGRIPQANYAEGDFLVEEAIERVTKHRESIIRVNCVQDKRAVDLALRCSLTQLATGETVIPPKEGGVALRYIRDRISVPRDMSIHAAQRLRAALEDTAKEVGGEAPPVPTQHRRDQNPCNFA